MDKQNYKSDGVHTKLYLPVATLPSRSSTTFSVKETAQAVKAPGSKADFQIQAKEKL